MQPVVLERVDGRLHAALIGPKDTARTKGGGARRQALHKAEVAGPNPSCAASTVSPQRAHTSPLWTGNSIQHASQIGTEEICGRGEPQRVQKAGRRAQLKASMGLRSTRATARQREVSDGGTSNVSEPESLRKTHLTQGSATASGLPWRQYTRTGPEIPLRQPWPESPTASCCRELVKTTILADNYRTPFAFSFLTPFFVRRRFCRR